jgi:hypothetical protein
VDPNHWSCTGAYLYKELHVYEKFLRGKYILGVLERYIIFEKGREG